MDINDLYDQIKQKKLKYPLLLKPALACGVTSSHILGVAQNFNGVRQLIENNYENQEVLIQELIQHNGVILKSYSILPFVKTFQRQSIPDIVSFNDSFIFNSQKSFKSQISDHLDPNFVFQNIEIDQNLIQLYCQYLGNKLGLSLFGADFIKDYQGNYYIVDVNYLPGYKEFTDLGEIFQQCLIKNHLKD